MIPNVLLCIKSALQRVNFFLRILRYTEDTQDTDESRKVNSKKWKEESKKWRARNLQ